MQRLPDAPAPPHPATRADLETALRAVRGPTRFIGWALPGAELDGLDLHGCHFTKCRAAQADFSHADLTETVFDHCDLSNTMWRGARLSATQFTDSKLTGAELEEVSSLATVFSRCLLVNACARNLSFRKQILEGIDFQGADLAGCDFRDAVFLDCSLRDANLSQARFEGADLRCADLGSLRLADASRFKGAIISKAQASLLLSGLGLKVT
ncbi:pentapeptide repeat-containing protein [Caulobacter radicis]|uniref:Pentapeptide repeat-containing protein n=1 Tax=Caulobacter radicis TaxID=2172650 RepID=A0A2T9IYS0_9CAUL|nr:pentapeptide repeat-containing protein [Caulobacter radicis]PVM72348.1 hypothetical protein DDF65_22495 [Caulobacter radicis]